MLENCYQKSSPQKHFLAKFWFIKELQTRNGIPIHLPESIPTVGRSIFPTKNSIQFSLPAICSVVCSSLYSLAKLLTSQMLQLLWLLLLLLLQHNCLANIRRSKTNKNYNSDGNNNDNNTCAERRQQQLIENQFQIWVRPALEDSRSSPADCLTLTSNSSPFVLTKSWTSFCFFFETELKRSLAQAQEIVSKKQQVTRRVCQQIFSKYFRLQPISGSFVTNNVGVGMLCR